MYKAICALIALVMLVVFLGPVSAAAPIETRMPTVILVAPVSAKREKDDNIVCYDRYCTEINPGTGPPADPSVAYSQENNYCTTLVSVREITEPNIDGQIALQNTGPPEVNPQPMRGILLIGIVCR
jgi:hypothetical protein